MVVGQEGKGNPKNWISQAVEDGI
jgi:hypothetical protein